MEDQEDVTKRFAEYIPESASEPIQPSRNVFIVHGREHKPLRELKTMLGGFGLNPIVLHEQPSGSRTIVEKLEKYSNVGYAFVMLTPDDVGFLSDEFYEAMNGYIGLFHGIRGDFDPDAQRARQQLYRKFRDIAKRVKRRARQNVILEFGYFIGKLGRHRVCCLHKGDVELPSDMHGIVYIPFKESVNEVKEKIEKELEEAGYENLYPPSVPKPM